MSIDYKFNEKALIEEFQAYIDSTYQGHYATNKFQSTEVIIERGHGTGFCMGNVDKYSNRYGKKGSKDDARKDLMKVLHYALIQLHIHDNDLQPIVNAQPVPPGIAKLTSASSFSISLWASALRLAPLRLVPP